MLGGFTAVVLAGLAWATPGSGVTTASPSSNDTAEALQLAPPTAPSQCLVKHFTVKGVYGGTFWYLSWKDNSSDEDGFIVEYWRKQAGIWVLYWSTTTAADSTTASAPDKPGNDWKFRVKAFNASGASAWSNWAH